MTFIKSTIPSSIPFGIYRFDHAYVNALKAADDNVIDPHETDRYCGPVYSAMTTQGPVAFFAPIFFDDECRERVSLTFVDGVFAGIVDFKRMLPCVNESFITTDKSNTRLSTFCNKTQSKLLQYAELVLKEYDATL